MNVLTLVHGRRRHLQNLIRSLEMSTLRPEALVIVQMNETPFEWTSPCFPIIHCGINSDDGQLPLAAARNTAAAHAPGDRLVFLDVDCMCTPDLLTRYADVLSRKANVIYQGEVIYLPRDAEAMNGQNDALANEGAVHPLHAGRRRGESIPHALFWSLNFACRRETFERIGGFDTRYCGYGGEDTDFAFRAASAGIPIEFVDALALHQFHEVIDPPLNHLATIVGNSRIFREKWGRWPMEGWLSQFEKMGFITISASEINIRRLPSREEIADATK